MKKLIYILILLIIPISVHASYGIENYRIDITVLENGDIEVLEAFKMNGVYNGVERVINYADNYDSYYGSTLSSTGDVSIYDGNGVILNEIRGINFDKEVLFKSFVINGDLFELSDLASKGDYGVYVINENEFGNKYIIYNHSKMNKDFYISYRLENMAIVHKDIAELGLNVFTLMNESIENLEIIVHVPNNENLLRVWTHRSLNSISEIIDSETVRINVRELDNNEDVDFRLIFDKEVISLSNKKTNIEALDNIYEIETRLDDEVNQKKDEEYNQLKSAAYSAVEVVERTRKRKDYNYALGLVHQLKNEDIKYELEDRLDEILSQIDKKEFNLKIIFTFITGGWTIGLIITSLIIYLKYDREYKTQFNNKYYFNIPNDYSPGVVGYLLKKRVDNNDLSASILNLISMKVISYEHIDKKNFKLTKLDHKLVLSEADKKLVKFLFDDKDEITLKELKEKANKNYDSFITNYSNWINKTIEEAEKESFYEDVLFPKLLGVIYSMMGIIVGFFIIEQDSFISPSIMIIFGIISLFYSISFTKWTKKGNEDRAKWMALKRFMRDFNKVDAEELPEIVLWEKYLAYAVTLKCSDKLTKAMKSKLKNKEVDDIDIILFNSSISNSINNVVKAAYSARNYSGTTSIY